ncbi:matrix metallopeptidase-21 isoform X1 [Clupea harengus]|uniref:Matrix metallopeptidase-21 isoform X1 n=2 Tax=Clupea harengus TaxID=7950 RepID=A0A6P8EXF9_CLUHA|nr:matrix metallopeptidase-21 isoform X1 [Clupea harengus]
MLTLVQLISLSSLTIFGAVFSEKLFHYRDRSDVVIPPSHQAELITDTDTAEDFLSKYGFITPVNWEDAQWDEEKLSEDFSSGDTMSLIQEGDSLSWSGNTKDPSENAQLITALKEFQRMIGLPVTGLFDDATKAAMNKPRCGVPDKEADSKTTAEHNTTTTGGEGSQLGNSTETDQEQVKDPEQKTAETRLVHTRSERLSRKKRHLASLLGQTRRRREEGEMEYMAFSKAVLRWRLIGEGYSSQLSIDDQRYIFRLAFRMWSEVSPLEFVEDSHSPLEDIDIRLGFGTGRHLGCTQRFDGAGREFAHAWFLGDIHFDDDEHFTAPNTGDGISLLKVAVHEIGHVLGLPHLYRAGSIMQPSYLPQESSFELDWQDRKAIQHLYGSCNGRFSAVFDWIRKERTPYGEMRVRFNTYFMRDGLYWLYENRQNRTRYGDPVAVEVGWHGIPANGVDAHVHVWTRGNDAIYFFKGSQFWKYDTENDQVFTEDEEGRRYPRPISEGFPGVPGPIDTAFYDRRDSQIYFFRGPSVYAFDVKANRLAKGYPKKITQVFPAVLPGDHPVANLDVAYFSYTHNAIFLLKDTSYWRVVSSRDRRRRPFLPYNGLLPHREVDEQWFDICNVHSTALRVARR